MHLYRGRLRRCLWLKLGCFSPRTFSYRGSARHSASVRRVHQSAELQHRSKQLAIYQSAHLGAWQAGPATRMV